MYIEEKKVGEAPLYEFEGWRKVLNAAADYMDEHGKCKNTFQNGLGQVCIIGALNAISSGKPRKFGASTNYRMALQILTKFLIRTGRNSGAIAEFSDDNTKETVVATLRECARWQE